MRKEIGILLAWVVFLSGCVGKPMEKQNEQTKKEDAVLRLYTLKENENLCQSAKLFMEKYPKYPVVIEVGISEEDGKTVSDAIRSLNTEIMAGNGPDIILMDGLPIEDYIEKGVLEDLSDVVKGVKTNGEEFFENVLSSYEKGENLYAVPSRFSVPIIIGKEGAVTPDEVTGLSGSTTISGNDRYVSKLFRRCRGNNGVSKRHFVGGCNGYWADAGTIEKCECK